MKYRKNKKEINKTIKELYRINSRQQNALNEAFNEVFFNKAQMVKTFANLAVNLYEMEGKHYVR